MTKTSIALLVIALLCACTDNNPPSKPTVTPAVQQPPKPDHNFAMQDGMKYGYPIAISEEARKAGQAAEQLVMVLYAGEKSGRHQIHIMDGVTVTAMECELPCQYIKAMTYIDNPYLKNQIKIEHIATAPGSLGYLIMEDATRGKLKQYGLVQGNKSYTVWIDEKKGMQRIPMIKN